MKKINTRAELVALKKELALRDEWHEPDDVEVTAEVHGAYFDKAGFWPDAGRPCTAPEIVEQHVVRSAYGEPVAAINLATLFAWATGWKGDSLGHPVDRDGIADRIVAYAERVVDAGAR